MTLAFRAPRQLAMAAAGALLGAAIVTGAAIAQPSDPSDPYGGYGGQRGPPPGQSYGADSQSQFARLHDALKITTDQEAAWRDFVAANAPDGQAQARQRSAQQMLPGLTSPQRVDLSLASMEADLDSFRTRGRALKAFYAVLTPAQQQVFDRETLRSQQADGGPYER